MDKKFLKRIIAQSQEDLQIISALCSEAKIKINNIKYLRSNKIFLIFLSRFNRDINGKPAFGYTGGANRMISDSYLRSFV